MKASELRRLRAAAIAKMQALVDGADHTTGLMTTAQEQQFTELEAQVAQYGAAITRAQNLERLGQELDQIPAPSALPNPKAGAPAAGFENFGELIYALRFRPSDRRLAELPQFEGSGARAEQEMETGAKGGFLVPAQMGQQLLQVAPQEAIFSDARVTSIPAGDPPDASITFPSLNQGSTQNMYGGVAVAWIAEGGAKPQTDVNFNEIKLEPKECAAYITVSDRLLRNWQAANALLSRQLRLALAASRDVKCLSGTGVGTPLGILTAAATIAVARTLANTVKFADIVTMLVSSLTSGSYVWVASDAIRGQLLQLEDNLGNLIFTTSARDGEPDRLMGKPILWNERSPNLGTKGDLLLVDPKYYLWKAGSGPFVAASEHVHFLNNKTVIKAYFFGDGQPWLSGPIVNEGGRTRSPFVALDVPAA